MSITEHFGQLKFAVANVESVGVTADDRSRAGYMPPFAVCSHLGVNGFADMLVKPYLRMDVRGAPRWRGLRRLGSNQFYENPENRIA